jgi:Tfp pilus assembly protein PilF
MRIRPFVVAAAAVLLPLTGSLSARGDVLYLTDGTKLEGDVKRSIKGWVVTDERGTVTIVENDKVQSIELKSTSPTTGPDAGDRKLLSLRRSVENLDSLSEIIDRYKRFIDQNAGTDLAKSAEKEMAAWVDRKDRGLVKVAGQWVTPAERDAMQAQTFAVVSHARQLIKDARFKEADAMLAKAAAADPTNASIQYLRGVLKYRTNEVPAARKAFDAVIEQIPNHMPSLNNLGVILARQKQDAASAGMFDRAMQAEPRARIVLDNFAEGFNAMTPDQRKPAVVQRALKRFLEQDEQLQQELREKGLYRWGSTWVSKEQLDELKVAEEKIKGKLDQLAAEFDAAQMRIKTIDDDVAANQRTMQQLALRRSYGQGANGGLVASDLPQRYYDLQAQNQQLADERAQQVAAMQRLRQQAKDVEKQVPTPRYTGVQKIVETDGTPLKLPEDLNVPTTAPSETPPSAQPATAPSSAPVL